jgi:glutathione synthase/RimK-type ligase-like ATP-grasp enzyme
MCYYFFDMKRIATFFREKDGNGYPFNKEYYRTAYAEMAAIIKKMGGNLYVVRGQESYLGGNRFSHYWEFDGTFFSPVEKELDADVIYVKAILKADNEAKYINPKELDDLCTDKWRCYEMFKKNSPVSFRASGKSELGEALKLITTGKAVAKPIDGEEGRDVMIADKDEILQNYQAFPCIVQEVIDGSEGIPGIVEGTHDFRITSINGEPVLSFARTPPQGSHIANISLGGKKIEVPLDQIPKDALALWKEVDESLSRFSNRLYSLDIARDAKKGWQIIELNSQPGCTCADEGPGSRYYQRRLAEHLLACA